MRKRIIIKRKSLEEFLKEEIPNFNEVVEATIHSRNVFGIVLKKGKNLPEATLARIKSKLSRNFELVVEDEPEEETRK